MLGWTSPAHHFFRYIEGSMGAELNREFESDTFIKRLYKVKGKHNCRATQVPRFGSAMRLHSGHSRDLPGRVRHPLLEPKRGLHFGRWMEHLPMDWPY